MTTNALTSRCGWTGLAMAACGLAALTTSVPASAQPDPRRGPPGCVPVSERQMERGCYILVSDPLGQLPPEPLHWHIDAYQPVDKMPPPHGRHNILGHMGALQPNLLWRSARPPILSTGCYPSRAAAEAAKGPRGTVVEALGRTWLMSVAEAGYRSPGGEHVAEVGPLATKPGTAYTAAYMEGIMLPGAESSVHHHPGPEALYTLAGEECMETAAGRSVGRPGGTPIVVPADVPHKLTITGTEERRSLVLVLHDSSLPLLMRTHIHGWTPKGLCGSE